MKIGENFKLTSNIQLNYSINKRVKTSARTGLSGVVFSAMRINPFIPLLDPDTGDFNQVGVNGEVITIDGGEWLKGAGQFNLLEDIPEEMWDQLEAMIKSKKSRKTQ